MHQHLAVLDVGTTNIKVAVFTAEANPQLVQTWSQATTKQHPQANWAEQDPVEILKYSRQLLNQAWQAYPTIDRLGLTNQRETIVAWDVDSRQPLYPAILWEDRRTQEVCDRMLKDQYISDIVRQKTGLTINSYFSATKMTWLLDHLKRPANLKLGTLDSWLIMNLTGRAATDYTNASRTMLFNIHELSWDEELLEIFQVPQHVLVSAQPSGSDFGQYEGVPLRAVIGDQQASLYAAGDTAGTVKVTYGTGIFPMKHLGGQFRLVDGLTTTLAVSHAHQPQYALEAKLEHGSSRTSPALHDPAQLKQVVEQIAQETAPLIKVLLEPGQTEVTIDGGISQNDDLVAMQERLNHIHCRRLSTFQGTSLGVAKLMVS